MAPTAGLTVVDRVFWSVLGEELMDGVGAGGGVEMSDGAVDGRWVGMRAHALVQRRVWKRAVRVKLEL